MRRSALIGTCIAIAAVAAPAKATVTLFTNRGAFVAAVLTPATDSFDDRPQVNRSSPIDRTVGAYSDRVSNTPGTTGLFAGSRGCGGVFVSTNAATDNLLFSGFSGGFSAAGADICGSNLFGNVAAIPSISVIFEAGGHEQIVTIDNPAATSFVGIVSTSGRTSFAIVGPGDVGGNFRWPSANNLVLASAIPEPASWFMLIAGFGPVGAAARRRGPRLA